MTDQPKGLTRREMLFGGAGFVAGGALATASGLSLYAWRRRKWQPGPPSVSQQVRTLVPSGGWMLTGADREGVSTLEDSEISTINPDTFDMYRDTDYFAGDLGNFRANSVEECAAVCESDPSCSQFTYARQDNPVENKRRMCWLKTPEITETRQSPGYWSGKKKSF